MKRAALAVLAAAALPLALPARGQPAPDSAPATPPKRRILVTAFEPFDGRPENNSRRIQQALLGLPDLPPDVEIIPCVLPVEYDRAADRATECIRAAGEPPLDAVISLGEVGCKVQLETSAGNLDDVPGFPDNAGVVRSDRPILPGKPPRIGFDLPGQALWCGLTAEDRQNVVVSSTMNYVCNNTAFHLANRLRGTGTRFGFIHVPTAESYCGDRSDPVRNAAMLNRMIQSLFAHDRQALPATYPLPHCTNDAHLPTALADFAATAAAVAEAQDLAECEREYVRLLKEELR